MNKFFEERINLAHAFIDQEEFEKPIKILKNLQNRIHDAVLIAQIKTHDNNTEKTYTVDYTKIIAQGGDPYEQFKKVHNLNKWRADEYLNYYDKVLKENDI